MQPVNWVLDKMISNWSNSSWSTDNNINPYEAGYLKLDISKAREKLGWRPTWTLDSALERIIDWHKAWKNKEDMQLLCLKEIEEYMKDMSNENP